MKANSVLGGTLLLSLSIAAGPLVADAGARTAAELARALASGGRAEADRARDEGRRPGEVVTFLEIGSGATVVDLLAASGYYTEVLSVAVGTTGKVYAQNTAFVLTYREGANDKAMTERLAGGRLANVERLDREFDDLGLAPGSVDAAVTALNLHDIVNGRGPEAVARFLAAVKTILKPGGVLGIIDHDADADKDNANLHRMPEAQAIELVKAAGFELVGQGEMLRNPADDHSKTVFDPSVRGKTDRFVLRLKKPAS